MMDIDGLRITKNVTKLNVLFKCVQVHLRTFIWIWVDLKFIMSHSVNAGLDIILANLSRKNATTFILYNKCYQSK